jgi:hypothetical protein
MKAKYSDVTADVTTLVDTIMNKWPDRFIHISRKDLCLIFKDADKSQWQAKTNVTNGLYRTLTGKKIIIQIHKQSWVLDKPVDRALLLFRELSRIDLNQKDKSEYKLLKPDLTDFKFLLNKIGLNHEHKDEFFSKVLAPVEVK